MVLSDISIKRPVVATVASLLLVVFGLFALTKLPVRETPDIEQPMVSVNVNYPGASAEVVESKIVRVIEDQLSGIEGMKSIQSQARDGNGNINIEFELGRDIDVAASDVRDLVSRVQRRLPEDADVPIVQKAGQDSEPIMWMNITSSTRTPMELSTYANTVLRPAISSIDGVALT